VTGTNTTPDTNTLIHDVRNRLNRISMQAELAKMLIETNASSDVTTAALDKILHATDECSQILTDLSNT